MLPAGRAHGICANPDPRRDFPQPRASEDDPLPPGGDGASVGSPSSREGPAMFIDHVIYGVVDVDATAERLRREHGLGSLPGGRHLGGTTNRLVPLEPPTFL